MNGFWQQNIASGEENRRFTYVHNRAVGRSENPEGGHYVLKWGFKWTFPGNQDVKMK